MEYKLPKDFVIAITGSPAVGKSTLIQPLAKLFNAQVLKENFNEVFDNQREKMTDKELNHYYIELEIERYKKIIEKGGNWFTDMSTLVVVPDLEICAKYNFYGADKVEIAYAKEIFSRFGKEFKLPELFILLTCDIEVAFQRRKKRNEGEDKIITWEYHADKLNAYNEFVRNEISKRSFVIEVDNTVFRNPEEMAEFIAKAILKNLDKKNGIIKI